MRRRRQNPAVVAHLKTLTHADLVAYCEAVLERAAKGEHAGPALLDTRAGNSDRAA